jgi:PfaD family protein
MQPQYRDEDNFAALGVYCELDCVNWEEPASTGVAEWDANRDHRNGHVVAARQQDSNSDAALQEALCAVGRSFQLTQPRDSVTPWTIRFLRHGQLLPAPSAGGAFVPACRLENLGDAAFRADHGLRYAYLAGSMANGIGSVEIVQALGDAGMLGFFGAAGLSLPVIERAIDRLQSGMAEQPFGCNLIHSPAEPQLEAGVVDLYLKKRVRLVEASAYLDLTLPLVRYRVLGIHRDASGNIVTPNRIIAKISRVEVATKFLAPPPDEMLRQLVQQGEITAAQMELARRIPVAQDLTAEADSAGHTDNRPAVTLLPTMLALRDRLQAEYCYAAVPRVGLAGGIATPAAVAAAFSMGAAYVLTGSVNQACVESGSSDAVRQMLAVAEQADTAMAPAADMFELGVKLQVLKRGTMFPMRAAKLYELYRACNGLADLSSEQRTHLEKTIFRLPLDEVWQQTRTFFEARDPAQIERAERDPRHKLALVFRWYLGQSSRWANSGEPSRQLDYQIWCGPAMGAFNEWARGSCLQEPRRRHVVTVAMNLLYGAAVLLRASCLRMQGMALPPNVPCVIPLELSELRRRLDEIDCDEI